MPRIFVYIAHKNGAADDSAAELLAAAHCLQYGKFAKIQPQLSALRDSLLQHIEILDREYAPWLSELGVS